MDHSLSMPKLAKASMSVIPEVCGRKYTMRSRALTERKGQNTRTHVFGSFLFNEYIVFDFCEMFRKGRCHDGFSKMYLETWKTFSRRNIQHNMVCGPFPRLARTNLNKFGRGDQGTIPRPWSNYTLMFGGLFLSSNSNLVAVVATVVTSRRLFWIIGKARYRKQNRETIPEGIAGPFSRSTKS